MRACDLANCINENDKCQYCKIIVFTDNFKFMCDHPSFRFGVGNYKDEDDEKYTLYFDQICNKENNKENGWCSVIRRAEDKKANEMIANKEEIIHLEEKDNKEEIIEEKDRKIHGAIK